MPATGFRSRAVSSTVLQYATAAAAMALNTFTTVLIVRGVSVQTYGHYTVLASVVAFVNLATSLGLAPMVQRFVPEFVAAGRIGQARRLVERAFLGRLAAGLVLALALLASRDLWAAWLRLPPEVVHSPLLVALVLAIAIASSQAQLLGDAVLISLLDHGVWSSVRIGYAIVKLALVAWALSIGGLTWLLAAWLASETAMLLPYGWRIWQRFAAAPRDTAPLPVKRLARYAAQVYGHNIGYFMRDRALDVFIIAGCLGAEAVAHYGVAYGFAILLLQFSPANQLRSIMTTLMVERHVKDPSPATLQRFFAFHAKLVAFTGLPLFLISGVFAAEVIRYVLNPAYLEVAPLFVTALLVSCVGQFSLIYHPLFSTTERTDVIFWGNVCGAVNVGLDLTLVPRWGLWGALTGAAAGEFLLYTYYTARAARLCGVRQPWSAYGRVLANLSLPLALGWFGFRPLVRGPVSLAAAAGTVLLAYLVCARWNRVFSTEERQLANGLLGRPVWVF